jgi:hypothetical protein
MIIRKLGGAVHKGANKLVGGAKMAVKSIGKNADEMEELGKEIGEEVVKKNQAIDKKIHARESYKRTLKEAKHRPVSEDGDDVVSKAIQYKTKAQEANSFNYDGKQYTRTGDSRDNYEYFTREGRKGEWTSISSSEYGKAKAGNVAYQAELGRQADINGGYNDEMGIAGGFLGAVQETWDGIPGWAKTTGIVAAGGIAGAALLSGGDDDYDD